MQTFVLGVRICVCHCFMIKKKNTWYIKKKNPVQIDQFGQLNIWYLTVTYQACDSLMLTLFLEQHFLYAIFLNVINIRISLKKEFRCWKLVICCFTIRYVKFETKTRISWFPSFTVLGETGKWANPYNGFSHFFVFNSIEGQN